MEFIPHTKGLHYLDLNQCDTVELVMAITAQDNDEDYIKYEVKKTTDGRKLQAMLEYPSQRDFEAMVCQILIKNCPISKNDVTNAYKFFGPDMAGLPGKTVRKNLNK